MSNFCYWRWNDAYPVVRKRIDDLQAEYIEQVKLVDEIAVKLYNEDSPGAAVDYITQYTVNTGTKLHDLWLEFYGELFGKWRIFATTTSTQF